MSHSFSVNFAVRQQSIATLELFVDRRRVSRDIDKTNAVVTGEPW